MCACASRATKPSRRLTRRPRRPSTWRKRRRQRKTLRRRSPVAGRLAELRPTGAGAAHVRSTNVNARPSVWRRARRRGRGPAGSPRSDGGSPCTTGGSRRRGRRRRRRPPADASRRRPRVHRRGYRSDRRRASLERVVSEARAVAPPRPRPSRAPSKVRRRAPPTASIAAVRSMSRRAEFAPRGARRRARQPDRRPDLNERDHEPRTALLDRRAMFIARNTRSSPHARRVSRLTAGVESLYPAAEHRRGASDPRTPAPPGRTRTPAACSRSKRAGGAEGERRRRCGRWRERWRRRRGRRRRRRRFRAAPDVRRAAAIF